MYFFNSVDEYVSAHWCCLISVYTISETVLKAFMTVMAIAEANKIVYVCRG